MPISLDPKAHYVTQSSIYSTQKGKPLTNRRISFYQKQGFYGPKSVFVRMEVAKKVRVKREKLFDKF